MSVRQTPRILVVDDEETTLFTLEELLGHFGYAITAATNATEALALILRESFDLLLIDLHLSGISGIEIAQRAQVHQPTAAILMLARGLDFRTARRDKQIGPFAYVRKTACPQEILDRVAELTQQQAIGA
jgi:CheY-like chemotaxis protein